MDIINIHSSSNTFVYEDVANITVLPHFQKNEQNESKRRCWRIERKEGRRSKKRNNDDELNDNFLHLAYLSF